MRHEGKSLREAYEYVRERKPNIQPNAGFMAQLMEREVKLYGGRPSVDLTEYKVDLLSAVFVGRGRAVLRAALERAGGRLHEAQEALLLEEPGEGGEG